MCKFIPWYVLLRSNTEGIKQSPLKSVTILYQVQQKIQMFRNVTTKLFPLDFSVICFTCILKPCFCHIDIHRYYKEREISYIPISSNLFFVSLKLYDPHKRILFVLYDISKDTDNWDINNVARRKKGRREKRTFIAFSGKGNDKLNKMEIFFQG